MENPVEYICKVEGGQMYSVNSLADYISKKGIVKIELASWSVLYIDEEDLTIVHEFSPDDKSKRIYLYKFNSYVYWLKFLDGCATVCPGNYILQDIVQRPR